MEVIFTPKALADLDIWQRSGNTGVQKKIRELLKSIATTPFSGIGKPEPLKHELSSKWSRRINHEHRIIYGLTVDKINLFYTRALLKQVGFS